MKKRRLVTSLILMIMVIGCNKPGEECIEEKLTAAFVLDYPDTVQVSVPFTFSVGYVVENSCGEFGEFEGEVDGNTIEAKLKTYYKGCSCVDEFQEKSTIYPLTFDEVGTYELRFWIAENEFDTYVVEVIE